MIKYLIKRKVENELMKNSKKIAMYTGVGVAVLGTGAYFSYKTIKRRKALREEIQYLEDEEYEINNFEEDLEKQELKDKVDEFNSRRICCENCEDASQDELKKYVDSISEDKKNVKIDENLYENDKYEQYENEVEE